jgi:polar amino acid transport system substrate-binding protein
VNSLNRNVKLFFVLLLLGVLAVLITACVGSFNQPATPLPATLPVMTHSNVITIVADDWCPYNCVPDSKTPGYIIELATEIFSKAGYQLKYEYVPWSRVIKGVENGTYDGAVGAAKGDIPSALFPEEEEGMATNHVFVRKGEKWQYAGIDSLKQVRLGVVGDYYYNDEINAYIAANPNSPKIDVTRGDDAVEQSLKKLLTNQIDVYIEDLNVFYYTAAQAGLDKDKFAIAGLVDEPQPIYIAFSSKNPEAEKWARILSDGIKEFRSSGHLAEILQRYGMKDWK